jgi:hypothetical protein
MVAPIKGCRFKEVGRSSSPETFVMRSPGLKHRRLEMPDTPAQAKKESLGLWRAAFTRIPRERPALIKGRMNRFYGKKAE